MSYQITPDKCLSPAEVQELLAAVSKHPVERDRLLVEVALATGARASELLLLTTASLLVAEQAVWIRATKGSRDRLVPIKDAALFERMQAAAISGGGRLFPYKRRRLIAIWHSIRPFSKGFHCLRHTRAVESYKKCKNIVTVQRILGHQNVRTTQVYVDYAVGADELREAL